MSTRQIVTVALVRGDADDVAAYWRAQKRHPRIYPRMARAEGLTVPVYVVVIDAEVPR